MSETSKAAAVNKAELQIGHDQPLAEKYHLGTPRAILDDIVLDATAGDIASVERVTSEANEVYRVEINDGYKVVVRISHDKGPRFEAEKWALDRLRASGIPTPKVLLIGERTEENEALLFCVEEYLEGIQLSAAIEQGPPQANVQLLANVARAISKMHQLPVEGFGYLGASGQGEYASWQELILSIDNLEPWIRECFRAEGLPESDLDSGLAILHAYAAEAPPREAVLNHGDLNLDNILVNGNEIVGVLDMQNAMGADKSFDYAWWDLINGHLVPVEQMLGEHSTDQLRYDIEIAKLWFELRLVGYFHEANNNSGLASIKEKLAESLRLFGT